MEVRYRDHAFEFDPVSGELFDGRMLLSQGQRERLVALLGAEDECWYLDEDGERLPDDRLFALSPWSGLGPTGPVKLLCRFLDLRDGSVRFETPESYPGDVWRWMRLASNAQDA